MTRPLPRRVEVIRAADLPEGELTVVIFGPGHGEAILVLLPDGRLCVVDGCATPRDAQSGRGDPLRELMADIAQARGCQPRDLTLALVALTHPHEDHYRGLADLLVHHEPQKIQRLATVRELSERYSRAWLALESSRRAAGLPLPDDLDFKGLVDVVAKWDNLGTSVELHHLECGATLLEDEWAGHSLSIRACAPSPNDLQEALKRLVRELELASTPGEGVVYSDPNATSGALVIEWGAARVLLAGDLIHHDREHSAWNRARRDASMRGTFSVVNVAHHASREAHHEGLWAQMEPAVAVITPFKRAQMGWPPRPDMIAQLAQRSEVYITAPPLWVGGPQHEVLQFDPPPPPPAPRTRMPGNSLLQTTPKTLPGPDAVAISLRADGTVSQRLLGGRASRYGVAAD